MNTDHGTWNLLSEHSGPFLRLQRTLRGRDGFALCLLVYSDSVYRARVADFLRGRLDATVEIAINEESENGIDALLERLSGVECPVQIVGLHLWATGLDDLLTRLNHRRESVAELFPHPLLVWIRSVDLRAAATRAADFWAWRTGVFDFALPAGRHRSSPHGYQTNPVAIDAAEREDRVRAIRSHLGDRAAVRPIDAELLVELGDLHRWEGDTESARKAYREAEEALAHSSDRRRLAIARGRMADLVAMRGDLSEAIRIRREEELPVYEGLGDMRLYALTKGEIADALTWRGDFADALRIRQDEELPIYEELGLERLAAVTKGRIADLLFEQGRFEEAFRIRQDEVLPWFEQASDAHSRAVTLGRMADMHMAQGQVDEALRIRRDEELPVYGELGDRRSHAATQAQVADILISRGELDEALAILKEALPVFEDLGNVVGLAFIYDKIANAYQGQQRLNDALRIRREKELPIYEKAGNWRFGAVTQGEIAAILEDLGRLEDALRIRMEHEIPAYERLHDEHASAVAKTDVAKIMMQQGRLGEALRILDREVLPVLDQLGDPATVVATHLLLASILVARESFDEALEVYRREVAPLYGQLGDERGRAIAMSRVAGILVTLGRSEEALGILREQVAPVFEALDDVERHTRTSLEIARLSGSDYYTGSRHFLPEGARARVERSDDTQVHPDRAITALKWGGPGHFDFGAHNDGSKLLGAALLLDCGVDLEVVRRVHEQFSADVIAELPNEWKVRVADMRAWLDGSGS